MQPQIVSQPETCERQQDHDYHRAAQAQSARAARRVHHSESHTAEFQFIPRHHRARARRTAAH